MQTYSRPYRSDVIFLGYITNKAKIDRRVLIKDLVFLAICTKQFCIFGIRSHTVRGLLFVFLCSFLLYIYHDFVLPGDTFTDGSVRYTMTSMNVPEPVMSLAVSPVSKDSGGQVSNFSKILV